MTRCIYEIVYKPWNSNINNNVGIFSKGKTYEKLYGEEKAKELKHLRSISTSEVRKRDAHILNKKALDNGRHVSQQKVTCEHCGKQLDKANYSRWHGNKCKSI